MKYLFILGNAPELALFELNSLLGSASEKLSETVAFADLENEEQLNTLKKKLGGTVKIAEIIKESNESEVAEKIANEIATHVEGRKDFGISCFDKNLSGLTAKLPKEVKNILSEKGINARFVLPAKGYLDLSSVVVRKQKLLEIDLVAKGDLIIIAKTIWVQDFEDWGKRDYGRPAAEGHIGMLPPKVARMMVNIAIPTAGKENLTLLDPFCGVGTILSEALVSGAAAFGIDKDKQQIERAKKNLGWVSQQYDLKNKYNLFVTGAQNAPSVISTPVDAIATEPDLGPSDLAFKKYPPQAFAQIVERLTDLYLSCLTNWKTVLKPGAKVVMIFPEFALSNSNYKNDQPLGINLSQLIDKAKIMGYSFEAGPFPYFRPQAVVRRNILIFKI